MRFNQFIDKFKLIEILLILIPLSAISGPLIPDLVMVSFSLMGLRLLFKKEYYSKFKFIYFFFILLCSYLILRSVFSDHIKLSFESSLFYIRYPLFALGFGIFLFKNINKITYFIYGIIISFGLIFFDSIFQFATGFNLLGFPIINVGRISSFFKDELVMGSFISRTFPILVFSLFYLFNEKKYRLYSSLTAIFLSAFILIYMSGERTALAIFLIGSFLIAIYIKNLWKIFLISAFFTIIVAFIINIYYPHFKGRIINHTISQLTQSTSLINIFSKGHQEHFRSAYLIYKQNIIFGKGPKTFRVECQKEENNPKGCTTHPHNIIFQLMAETGLIGISFFLTIYFLIIKNLISLFYNTHTTLNTYKYLMFTCIFINFFPLIPSGNLFNNWLNFIFYLPLSILVFIKLAEYNKLKKT